MGVPYEYLYYICSLQELKLDLGLVIILKIVNSLLLKWASNAKISIFSKYIKA
jgi:hypothetical protein